MSNLIIWDKETEIFLKDFKKNDDKVITGLSDFNKYDFNKCEEIKAIIILLELNWEDDKTQCEFLGIEKTKIIRLRKCKLPIIFISSISSKHIISSAENYIVLTPAIAYISLKKLNNNILKTTLEKTNALTDIQLEDVIHHYSSFIGIVDNIFHEIKANVRDSKNDDEYKKIFINNSLNQLKELVKEYQNAINKINEIILEVKSGKTSLVEFDEIRGDEITRFLPNEEGNIENDIKEEKSWAVLMLDDQQGELENLKAVLKRRGISDIRTCETVAEAKEIIIKDQENRIVLAISDYRLFDKEDKIFNGKKLQPEQGYDFLVWLSKQDRHSRLVALSGLSRKFLQKSFRNSGIRVGVHSKNEINGNGANVFADEIEKMGDEVNNLISHLPNASTWKELVPFYRHFRNSADYQIIEDKISLEATKIVMQITSNLNSKKQKKEDVIPITRLPELKAEFKKGEKSPETIKHFIQFKNKLIARRVALWLYHCKKFGRNYIYVIINNQTINFDDYAGTNLIRDAGVFFNRLGLRLDDCPYNLLIEERNWLQYDMDTNICYEIEILNNLFYDISNIFKKFFEKFQDTYNFRKESETNYSVSIEHNKKEIKLFLDKEKKPIISSYLDLQYFFKFLLPVNFYNEDRAKLGEYRSLISEIQDLLDDEGKLKYPNVRLCERLFALCQKIKGVINNILRHVENLGKDQREIIERIIKMIRNDGTHTEADGKNRRYLEIYGNVLLFKDDIGEVFDNRDIIELIEMFVIYARRFDAPMQEVNIHDWIDYPDDDENDEDDF